jgi:uncharacterized protein YjbJ (UPF0337 family)
MKEKDMVDQERIKGAGKQIKGKIKDTAGKATGDPKLQGEGKADKAEGKVQSTVGGLKDKARESVD